ncbi:MAG: ABC transporter permease [Melioribacteraceae bacterium]|nr:ABC transporter permease [Melioribacteraceae bacterium]
MLYNYLKVALRNLFRHKTYSFINIVGLALGLACSIFILLWVQDELSYDRFYENADNIYRVEQDQYYSGESYHVNVTPFPIGPGFKSEVPEIENAARLAYQPLLIKYKENAFYESEIVAADQSYLDVFGLGFVKGDKSNALREPYSIVISEELAEKYFGKEDALGKILTINNKYDFKVTGLIEKIPLNASFRFQAAIPFEFLKETGRWSESWGANSIITFVQLQHGADLTKVNKKITELVSKNNEDSQTQYMLAPITGLHLFSYFGFGKPDGAIQYVYIFSGIALFVLLIACINFMNLSTARSANRSKEIGMRKVVGANRKNLINQFFGESLLLSFIGMIFSLIIIALLLNQFNDITAKQISLSIFFDYKFVLGFLVITIFTGIIAGGYPALFLSSFRPVKILKGSLKSGVKNSLFRKVLVLFQFSLSIFLIIGTLVVYNQLIYMQSKSLGYDKEHVLYFQTSGELAENYQLIKDEFLNTKGVIDVSGASHPPSMIGSNSGGANWEGKDPEQTVLIGTNVVDFNYTKTMKIDLLAGRGFSYEFTSDLPTDSTGKFLVNEEVVKVMGVTNNEAIGARFEFMGVKGSIVGVMKNFHFNSMRTKIEPLAMVLAPEYIRFTVVRIAPGNISETIDNMKAAWESILPGYPFEYRFIDEDFERLYRTEERMVDLLKYFSAMAIIIACLGLFGLASFTAEQRKKEIGIRKVLGASEIKLTYLLCRDFLLLVIIASFIAWPISYFILGGWLESFAYRINLSSWMFIISGLLTMVVALGTVGWQAVKAAIANPVDSLRNE